MKRLSPMKRLSMWGAAIAVAGMVGLGGRCPAWDERGAAAADAPVKSTSGATPEATASAKGAKPLVKKPARSALPSFTEEREAAALVFVRREQPEFAAIVERLKSARPEEYRQAIRELFHTSELLSTVREVDADLHAIQLREWKTRSRLQLLLARYGMSPSPELKSEIREALREQAVVRVERARREVEVGRQRLAKAEQLLQAAELRAAADLDRELEPLLRRVQAGKAAVGLKGTAGEAEAARN